MKVMISLPMAGRSDVEVRAELEDISERLRKLHIEPVDNFIQECHPINETVTIGCWYLGKSLELMSKCDAVFFHKKWNEARGCRVERKICEEYGIKILDWEFLYPPKRTLTIRDDGIPIGRALEKTDKDLQDYQVKLLSENENHIPRID